MTSYIFQVPKPVMSMEAPNTNSRAKTTFRPLPTETGLPAHDCKSCMGMASGVSAGMVPVSFWST